MDDAVDMSKYTDSQLRDWLQQLGTKAALALALTSNPSDERGETPVKETKFDNVSEDENFSESNDDGWGEITVNDAAIRKEQELMRREIETLKKEKELLARENELLKKMAQLNANDRSMTTGAVKKVTKAITTGVPTNMSEAEQQYSIYREMLPEFDGSTDVNVWLTQMRNVKEVYNVDDKMLLTLFTSKLKGKAQDWLYAQPNFLRDGIDKLSSGLKEAFRALDNKLIVRRRFEARKWLLAETFGEYFQAKMRLATGLRLDEEELVEHIIEGFTDGNIRVHAHVQNFTTTAELYKGFHKIMQRPRALEATGTRATGAATVRRYNCNSLGHMASVCLKPRREYRGCYACGVAGHGVATCPDRKLSWRRLPEEGRKSAVHIPMKPDPEDAV